MSRRKEANRAETIVRGIGAIIMVILLWGMVNRMPGLLAGKNQGEAMAGLLHALTLFVGIFCAISVIGLIVWFKVLKGPRTASVLRLQTSDVRPPPSSVVSPPSSGSCALSCADCGTPITTRMADYCRKQPGIFGGKCLCMPCQDHYRP